MKNVNMNKNQAGGSATSRGMSFQHRVSAWVAVHILAEKNVSLPWEIGSSVTFERIECETRKHVDDLNIVTSDDGIIYCQIKRSPTLSKNKDSDLASALDQFVRQFCLSCEEIEQDSPYNRPLDIKRDRFILLVSGNAPKTITVDLRNLLNKIRQLDNNQCLDEGIFNKKENQALEIVSNHITDSWQKITGRQPTKEDIKKLLQFVYIYDLDIERDGKDEKQAKDILRQVVLRNPDQDEKAWNIIIQICEEFANTRTGANRHFFQDTLLKAGIQLNAVKSYQKDIKTLIEYSQRITRSLSRFAEIKTDSNTIKIQRTYAQVIKNIAEKNSVLVIGDPGSGKTGVLYDFVQLLLKEQRGHIFFAVDQMSAHSLDELKLHLDLEHNLIDILNNWPGTQPAFLVIDALDAARGAPVEKVIKDLIRFVIEQHGRWKIIASIRKFDLRYGEEIQKLFAGEPVAEFCDPEFRRIRHINISTFTDDELMQIASHHQALYNFFENSSPSLKHLFRNPFNLQLLTTLLDSDLVNEKLDSITTQVDLLDKYWRLRVLNSNGDDKEAILQKICELMLSFRRLQVDRYDVIHPGSGEYINELLSSQILIEHKRYILSFSHHIIFDYAVSLLFRGRLEKVVDKLCNNPELILIARPSLVFHFHYLWGQDNKHQRFWNVVLNIMKRSDIPEIGKLIGPTEAAKLSSQLSDLELLFEVLKSANKEKRKAAEGALQHLINGLWVTTTNNCNFDLWCEFLEKISRSLRESIIYPTRKLLMLICDKPDKLSPSQLSLVGQAARRLLEFAWSTDKYQGYLVSFAIEHVCRTFNSNSIASAKLLRRCLKQSRMEQYGYLEIPSLTRQIKWLIDSDPDFVVEIYRIVFSYRETSEELVPLGQSQILVLTSTKKQDYEQSWFHLTEVFPIFLNKATGHAISALISVLEIYLKQYHYFKFNQSNIKTFNFNHRKAYIIDDGSCIWDDGLLKEKYSIKMLDYFQAYIEKLSGNSINQGKLARIINIIIDKNQLAVIWRRLLMAGTRFPDTLGMQLLPLLWGVKVLLCDDTTVQAGEFIRKIYPLLDKNNKIKIEQTLLAIPDCLTDYKQGEKIRARLLGCLSGQELVCDEAQRLLNELETKNGVPANKPFITHRYKWKNDQDRNITEFQKHGRVVDSGTNSKIFTIEQRIREFANQDLNTPLSLEEIKEIFPSLRELYKNLKAKSGTLSTEQRDYIWDTLTRACKQIARLNQLSCNEDEIGKFVKNVLVEASEYPTPQPDTKRDARFDEFPSWGTPAPRIEAAIGLLLLSRHSTCASKEVRKAIKRLAHDPVPAVRHQIANYIYFLFNIASEFMWNILEEMCQKEKSTGVLRSLVARTLGWLRDTDTERVVKLLKDIFEKTNTQVMTGGPGIQELRRFCLEIFTDIYIRSNHQICQEILNNCLFRKSSLNYGDYFHILGCAKKFLNYRLSSDSDEDKNLRNRARKLLKNILKLSDTQLNKYKETYKDVEFQKWPKEIQEQILGWAGKFFNYSLLSDSNRDLRNRARELLENILELSYTQLNKYKNTYKDVEFQKWPKEIQEQTQILINIFDSICRGIFIISKQLDDKQKDSTLTYKQRKIFYKENYHILDILSKIKYPGIIYHFLKTLKIFITINPENIFFLMGQSICAGEKYGYQYESLAINLFVELTGCYLADHRTIFSSNSSFRELLIKMLDIFVRAGWPEAQKLVYRLEEIFR